MSAVELRNFFEVQDNEIQAIRAIYATEFEELSRAADDDCNWSFKIKLDLQIPLKADLVVKCARTRTLLSGPPTRVVLTCARRCLCWLWQVPETLSERDAAAASRESQGLVQRRHRRH